MRYAIIRDGVVESAIEWDGASPWTPPEGTVVKPAGDDVGSGWTDQGDHFEPPVVVPPTSILIPKNDFMERFTQDELDGVEIAAQSQTDSMQRKIAIRARRRLFNVLNVDLLLPETAELVGALIQVQLLAPERGPEILAL